MASTALVKKYESLLKKLFPRGVAWRIQKGSIFEKFIQSLAVEHCRVEDEGYRLIKEVFPDTTFELLPDWERLLGIPDECTPDPDNLGSLSERRSRVLQKLTAQGGQNAAFYILLAQQLGYDIDVIDVIDFDSFKVGQSRVGDRLTNGPDWAFTWAVVAPATLTRFFRTGKSTVGERLVLVENETLECVIRKFSPAHTKVLFFFDGTI